MQALPELHSQQLERAGLEVGHRSKHRKGDALLADQGLYLMPSQCTQMRHEDGKAQRLVPRPFGAGLLLCRGRTPCRMDDTMTGSAFRVISGKEYRSQTLLHVPFHEVSQHAQEDVADESRGPVVVDGPYFEVHALEAPEGLLYSAEPLVIAHHLFRSRLVVAGADGIHAVNASRAIEAASRL